MKAAIRALLDKGAIEQCDEDPDQFISPYFLIKKSDGSDRFILNLQELNFFVSKGHFKMEDFKTAIRLTFPGYYMAKLDLKDAFFLLPVHRNYRIYLRFRFNKILYQFTCLPFGLCICPYIFTKILKPVVSYLRTEGLTSVIYLDDLLCIGRSKSECQHNVQRSMYLLQWLGFLINFSKSILEPSQSCQFLGFIIDSKDLVVRLPQDKASGLLDLIRQIRTKKDVKIVTLAQLVGKMVSYTPAV